MNRSADPNSDKMRAEFRQKLEKYEATPSESLWDKIELSLEKDEALVYKNRFRVYSRLAAACLLLLLGFSAFFIPQKLKDLQNETTGIATSQPQVKNDQVNATANQHAENPSANSTEIASENAILSAGKTTETYTENQQPKSSGQLALRGRTTAIPKTRSGFVNENNEAAKAVAYGKQKVKPQAKPFDRITPGAPQNAIAFTSKTARAVMEQPQTFAAASPETSPAEALVSSQPVPENTAKATASEVALTQENTGGINNFKADATAGKPEKVDIAGTFKENVSAGKSAPVLSTEDDQENISLLNGKTSRLKLPANKLSLPDTNILAAIPETGNQSETEIKENKPAAKQGKWLLAVGYSGSRFHSGMRLASQAVKEPGNSLVSMQDQDNNIAQYEAAIREFNEENKPAYSQAFSFLAAFKFSENWLVQSGLKFVRNQSRSRSHYAFSNRGYGNTTIDSTKLNHAQPVFEVALNNSFDPVFTEIHATEAKETTYRFQQIGLPLHIRYQTKGKTLFYFADAGGTLYRLKAAVVAEENQETAYPISGDNKHYYSLASASSPQPMVFRKWLPALELQTGIGYHIAKHWQLELALEGEQYLKPLFQNEHETGIEQQNPASISAALKLGYSF